MNERRVWPEPPLQPLGSDVCESYAAAYIDRLLGFDTTPAMVQAWNRETRRVECLYPKGAHSLRPQWCMFDDWEVSGWAYSHTPGFRQWVRGFCATSAVGFAVVHLMRGYGHAVVILEADDEGVLLADSVRGLIREPWEPFERRAPDMLPTRVEAWYSLPAGWAMNAAQHQPPPRAGGVDGRA